MHDGSQEPAWNKLAGLDTFQVKGKLTGLDAVQLKGGAEFLAGLKTAVDSAAAAGGKLEGLRQFAERFAAANQELRRVGERMRATSDAADRLLGGR